MTYILYEHQNNDYFFNSVEYKPQVYWNGFQFIIYTKTYNGPITTFTATDRVLTIFSPLFTPSTQPTILRVPNKVIMNYLYGVLMTLYSTRRLSRLTE